MRGVQKLANRVTTGMVVAALVIGAALIMRVDPRPSCSAIPALAIVLFLHRRGRRRLAAGHHPC